MVHRFESEENNPRTIKYQAVNPDGSYLTQEDVEAIRVFVYDTDTATAKTPEGGEEIDPETAVYDTLQSWSVDDTGYNIRIPISGVYLSEGGATYRVEVKITPMAGEDYYLDFVEIKTVETFSI